MKQREPIADTEPRETQMWQIVWAENGAEHREPVEVVRDQPSGRYAWRAHAQRAGYAWAATPAVAAHRLIEDVCPFAETVECIPREVPSRKSALARAPSARRGDGRCHRRAPRAGRRPDARGDDGSDARPRGACVPEHGAAARADRRRGCDGRRDRPEAREE